MLTKKKLNVLLVYGVATVVLIRQPTVHGTRFEKDIHTRSIYMYLLSTCICSNRLTRYTYALYHTLLAGRKRLQGSRITHHTGGTTRSRF